MVNAMLLQIAVYRYKEKKKREEYIHMKRNKLIQWDIDSNQWELIVCIWQLVDESEKKKLNFQYNMHAHFTEMYMCGPKIHIWAPISAINEELSLS